jgi:predicted phage terminase large subunit-like protein
MIGGSNGAAILLRRFESFARMSFRHLHDGRELGDDPYIAYVCGRLALVRTPGARIVLNMPPRHLKTYLAPVFLAAWLLAWDPAERIIVVTYSEQLALHIAYQIRKLLQSRWYMAYFATRIADDRTRVADFATTAGGGVYAVSAGGSITGRGASTIVFDDPVPIDEAGNLDQIEKVNERFDTLIMSRLDNPKTGRVVISAHRLHQRDLSGHVLETGEWELIALPFIAPNDQDYDLGGRVWHRRKGELLRPDAFTKADIARIKSIINPDFEALYQQFLGETSSIRICGGDFGSFTFEFPDAAIVISVDPADRPGPKHSFTVMQALCSDGDDFLLLDQWRAQTDLETACRALRIGTTNSQPAAVIIEWSGYGSALARDLRKRFSSLEVRLIPPDGRSKTERLLRHIDLIRYGKIKLPHDAPWREEWDFEFEQFPHGGFDDQVDALTQALDFMLDNPKLRVAPQRCVGLTRDIHGVSRFANQTSWIRPAYAGLRRRGRTKRIFPAQDD